MDKPPVIQLNYYPSSEQTIPGILDIQPSLCYNTSQSEKEVMLVNDFLNRLGIRSTPEPEKINQNYVRKQPKDWRLKMLQPLFRKIEALTPGEDLLFQSPDFTLVSYVRKQLYKHLNKKEIKWHFEIKQPSANELIVLRKKEVIQNGLQ